jgi:predicted helicase
MPTLVLNPTHEPVVTYYDNRLDDEQYILRLIGQVITVSLATANVVKELSVNHHP